MVHITRAPLVNYPLTDVGKFSVYVAYLCACHRNGLY